MPGKQGVQDTGLTEPKPARKRPPFRRLSSDQRREEIIAAAVQLLGKRPESEVSIDQIAAAAGTSRSSLYRYFETKQELYVETSRQAGAELVKRLAEAGTGPPSVQAQTRITRFFDFIEEFPVGYQTLVQVGSGPGLAPEDTYDIVQEVREQIYEVIYQVLDVTEPGQTMQTVVRSWLAGVERAGVDWLRLRHPPREEVEPILNMQLGVMLIAAGAVDPEVAERVEWMMDVEPTDGPFAALLRLLAGMFSLRMLSKASRLLASDPGGEISR